MGRQHMRIRMAMASEAVKKEIMCASIPQGRIRESEVEAAAAGQGFAGYVVGEGGAEEEDGSGGFFGGAETAEGAALFEGVEGLGGDANLDVRAVHVELGVVRRRLDETRLDEAEADGVDVDVVAAPLLRHGLSQADDASLGGPVAGLAGITVGAGD